MEEKRSALTSLRAHKKKFVGSLRTGNAVRDVNPGVVNQENAQPFANAKQLVHEDEQQGAIAPPQSSTTVIRSIIDSAKKKENVHEPGPWNKAKLGKTGKLFGRAGATSQPGFAIMEDEGMPPIPCKENLFVKGIQLSKNYVSRNLSQKEWNVPTVIDEPVSSRSIPLYEKFFLYPSKHQEISADEYRGYKWFKDRGIIAPITEEHDSVWSNGYDYSIRIPPGFVAKNVPQVEKVNFAIFQHDEQSMDFIVPLTKMYPPNGEVISFEELMAEKFKRGEIKLVTEEDFEETVLSDDMDLTVIGDRRQSVYPGALRKSFIPRKSIVPRKSVYQPPPLDDVKEDEEDISMKSATETRVRFEPIVEALSTGAIRKSIFKRKLEESEAGGKQDQATAEKRDFVSETPPRSNFHLFKSPAPVEKKPIRPLEFEEDDCPNFGANDTCSTQQFNLFIKAQSVSTPVSKKLVPRLVPLATSPDEESNSDSSPLSNPESITAAGSVTPGPPEHHMPKQLSTIMETTEQSKSSVSSVNETDAQTKTPKHFAHQLEAERLLFNPMLLSFRIPEDQTETCSKITVPLRAVPILDLNATPLKVMSPVKAVEVAVPPRPAFEIFEDETMKSPPIMESFIKSPSVNNSMKAPGEMLNFDIPEMKEDANSFEIPATQDVEIPETQDVDNPDAEDFEIPATQDVEVPEACNFVAPQAEGFEIPATQDLEVPETCNFEVPQAEGFEIPATQDVEVPETCNFKIPEDEDFEIPTEQDEAEDFEIPATQEVENEVNVLASQSFDIPETQPMDEAPAPIEPNVAKKDSFCFNIYEDSLLEIPKPQGQPKFFSSDDDGTGFLHMSRKENLVVQPPPSHKRTVSEEFFDLLKSPQPKSDGASFPSKSSKNNVSDLLKFSGASQLAEVSKSSDDTLKNPVSLENTLKNLSLDLPASASPTAMAPNIFEEDLNTEKFSLALGNYKNSTLLGDLNVKPATELSPLDWSFEMTEEEMKILNINGDKPTEKIPVPDFKLQEPIEFKVPEAPVFKAPSKPAAKVQQPSKFEIFEDSEDGSDDLSRSIYVQKPAAEPDFEEEEKEWEDDLMASFIANACNEYEHTIVEYEHETSLKVQEAIGQSLGNPFDDRIREAMLDHCQFSIYLKDHVKSCTLLKKIPLLKPGAQIECAGREFTVQKFIAKGGFGSIYTAKDESGKVVAMKQEKPANLWEYYVCVEIMDRLKNKQMIPAFMSIDCSIIANNASVFITQFSSFGTIIDMCNKHRNSTGKNVDEYVVMVLASQLLSIIDHLHGCKIIHADIKPDNFLLMSK